MWHSCTTFSFFFYINENVDTVNGYKHRINSSTQVFCNTSATGVKMRLRVQVLTGRLNR